MAVYRVIHACFGSSALTEPLTDSLPQATSIADAAFPQAPRFRAMKDNGALAPPSHAARAIWSLLDRDLDNGAILHVRDLT